MPGLLYIDSSAFFRRVFGDEGSAHVEQLTDDILDGGGSVVSSRLLWLEARRVAVRERLAGNEVEEVVGANLAAVEPLPLDEDVWAGAHAIERHVKTLDGIHLATCVIAESKLLTFDDQMASAARALGITIAS